MTDDAKPWVNNYPGSVSWNAPLAVYPVYELFANAAKETPQRICMDFFGRKWTYSMVERLIRNFAASLQHMGVRKGDRVALLLPNTPYYVISYFAILRIGGIVVNVNPLYAERELVAQLVDSGSSLIITVDAAAIYNKLSHVRKQTPLRQVIVGRLSDVLPPLKSWALRLFRRRELANNFLADDCIDFKTLINREEEPYPVSIDPVNDCAVLQYTGGTTGIPKGAMLTHANLTSNVEQARMIFPEAGTGALPERMLAVLPFFHVFAMTVALNITIRLKGELILLPRFELEQLFKTIQNKRPTLFPAVPTIYNAIVSHPDLKRHDMSSIRWCISGGAPLPIEVKREFENATKCVLVEGYGLSETSPVVACNPVHGLNKEGSIGLPLPGTTIEIVSIEDGTTIMPQGSRGEICVKGPQVMKGYWRHNEETANVLKHLPDNSMRLYTGDVGYMDADGYTYVVDRLKDMITAGGFKIYPRMVEEAIWMHPAIAECVVAGVPDKYRGSTVKAWIRLRIGHSLTSQQLVDFLKDKLSPIEMPKIIEFRDHLPHTLIGKLSRRQLVEEETNH